MLGGAAGGIGDMLSGALGDAGKVLGGNKQLALGGLGALAGALLGGGGKSMKGALGGGVMALLGAMAFSALKGGAKASPREVPLGLREPRTEAESRELEDDAQLVFKAMITAAKADGQIDAAEVQRIIGKLEEAGADSQARDFVLAEMNRPSDPQSLVDAAAGRPYLAAELYAASLLAIEVDTPGERAYLQRLADGFGLGRETVAALEKSVGLH
jgi:uncharacterized membrane protein YebE (DUF533 family)